MQLVPTSFLLAFVIAIPFVLRQYNVQSYRRFIGGLVSITVLTSLIALGAYLLRVRLHMWALDYQAAELEIRLVPLAFETLTAVVAAALACAYAVVIVCKKSLWKLAATLPCAGVLLMCVLFFLLQGADIALSFRKGPRVNLSFAGTAESLVLEGLWAPRGIDISSRFFDLVHSSVQIRVKAKKIRAYGGPEVFLRGITLEESGGVLLRTHEAESVHVLTKDQVTSQLPEVWHIDDLRDSTYTISSVHLRAPPVVREVFDVGSHTVSTQASSGHAVLIFPRVVSGSLNPGGLKRRTGNLATLIDEVTAPQNLPTLHIKYLEDPVWGFGSNWSSLDESQARRLLPPGVQTMFISPEIFHYSFAPDRVLRDRMHYGGALDLSFIDAPNAILVLTESKIRDTQDHEASGTLVFMLTGVSEISVEPMVLSPKEGFLNSGANWSLLLQDIEQTDGILISAIEAGNVVGDLTRGSEKKPLPAPPNTFSIVGKRRVPLRLSVVHDKLFVRVDPMGWREATVNGETLWPSWWQGISRDARAGIIGGIVVFLLGIWFTNQRALLTGLRWIVLGRDGKADEHLSLHLVSGEQITAASWRFAGDPHIGEKVCIIEDGTVSAKGETIRMKDTLIPLSRILSIRFGGSDDAIEPKDKLWKDDGS